ncbi:nucleolar protein 9 [Sarcoptes scabiei]|nr:nucleolar protein 9 [Sarcoptes scabiei]
MKLKSLSKRQSQSDSKEKKILDGKNAHEFLDQLLRPRTMLETETLYSNWSTTYEKDIKEMGYNGGPIAAKYFLQMNFDKSSKILDIGAGTGIVGEILSKNGFNHIDALDSNEEMLKILAKKNCYQNLIQCRVEPQTKLPINDREYDCVILAGVFCPGHIDYHSLEQILRITKSGGFICWSMGNPKTYADRDELYAERKFERYIEKLCDQLKWISVLGYPLVVDDYLEQIPGLFYAMQVI